MKARYHLPPDAYARLRMLSNLAAAREAPRVRPVLEPTAGAAHSAVEPAAPPARTATVPESRGH